MDEDWEGRDDAVRSGTYKDTCRIEGEVELALSEIERCYDLSSAEAALHMVKTGLRRVRRHEGDEHFYQLLAALTEILGDMRTGVERAVTVDVRHRAN